MALERAGTEQSGIYNERAWRPLDSRGRDPREKERERERERERETEGKISSQRDIFVSG